MVASALPHQNPNENLNPTDRGPGSPALPTNPLDALAALQVKIARRADEIAALLPGRTPLNLYCWLQAEQEMLATLHSLDHRADR